MYKHCEICCTIFINKQKYDHCCKCKNSWNMEKEYHDENSCKNENYPIKNISDIESKSDKDQVSNTNQEQKSYKSMTEFNKLGKIYPRTFALTFLFRPWLKFVIIFSCVIIALVLVLYSLKGLEAIIKIVNEKQT